MSSWKGGFSTNILPGRKRSSLTKPREESLEYVLGHPTSRSICTCGNTNWNWHVFCFVLLAWNASARCSRFFLSHVPRNSIWRISKLHTKQQSFETLFSSQCKRPAQKTCTIRRNPLKKNRFEFSGHDCTQRLAEWLLLQWLEQMWMSLFPEPSLVLILAEKGVAVLSWCHIERIVAPQPILTLICAAGSKVCMLDR